MQSGGLTSANTSGINLKFISLVMMCTLYTKLWTGGCKQN